MATTTDTIEKTGKAAEVIARTTQQGTYTAMDYTVKAQEVNTELLRKTTEVWIEGFRKQAELSQDVAEEFFKRAEDQAHAYQDFFGQWSFPLGQIPYNPFGFWSEWTQIVQQTAQSTQRTAWDTQKATAPPTNGSLPIAGYDEKGIREIIGRLNTLTADQLEWLKDYERRSKNRGTLIREIDRRIRATS